MSWSDPARVAARRCLVVTLALGALFLAGPCPTARANSSQVPLSFVDRPLSLPAAVMRLDAGERWPLYDAQLKHIMNPGPDQLYLNPGLSFGLTERLDLGFVIPIQVNPDSDLADPRVHLLYEIDRGDVSWGIFGRMRAGFDGGGFSLLAGVPLYARLTPAVRLETGGFLELVSGDPVDAHLNLIAPLSFVFQVTDRFHVGPELALVFYGLAEEWAGVDVALGGGLGYTLGAAGNPLGDLYGRVRLGDVDSESLELMFGVEFFFDL